MTRWILIPFLLVSGWVLADEHPACQELALAKQPETSEALLAIAQSCRQPDVAQLYYNRARYRDLLKKFTQFENSLSHYGKRENLAYIDAYRIYIGLAEAFLAPLLSREDPGQALEWLNQVYEQSEEIAELRFKGYGMLADQLELKQRRLLY